MFWKCWRIFAYNGVSSERSGLVEHLPFFNAFISVAIKWNLKQEKNRINFYMSKVPWWRYIRAVNRRMNDHYRLTYSLNWCILKARVKIKVKIYVWFKYHQNLSNHIHCYALSLYFYNIELTLLPMCSVKHDIIRFIQAYNSQFLDLIISDPYDIKC